MLHISKVPSLMTLLVTIAITGCSPTISDISCSDKNVQKTVIKLATNPIAESLFKSHITYKAQSPGIAYRIKGMDYPALLKLTKKNKLPELDDALSYTNKILKKLRLENMRMDSRNQDANKMLCAANLVAQGKADITYSVHLTEQEELYVEVFGL